MAVADEGKPVQETVVRLRPSQWTSEPETEQGLPLHLAARD